MKTRAGEEALSDAFDCAEAYLERMDRQGVQTSVLSLLGMCCWIESQPLEQSLALCRAVNNSLSQICEKYEGRFVAHAALPLVDIPAAAAELERALSLPASSARSWP